jgi:hypothetical protein
MKLYSEKLSNSKAMTMVMIYRIPPISPNKSVRT